MRASFHLRALLATLCLTIATTVAYPSPSRLLAEPLQRIEATHHVTRQAIETFIDMKAGIERLAGRIEHVARDAFPDLPSFTTTVGSTDQIRDEHALESRGIVRRGLLDGPQAAYAGVAVLLFVGLALGLGAASIAVFGYEWKKLCWPQSRKAKGDYVLSPV
ncbi:hypothetical protein GQ53DRAFT_511449 [Thozetella sp. PMI_491]|nr:hypothetical protein GQ53DRAFT_511449 [Thozetella sp. PMI_491]